ncbi:hypothetical protein RND71_030920 [Anisodus tanguticus]|uniref:Uncharacterized protein n=1 Tax=Anisodus tanguticus TaxID=243964 RepID=A0AAE1V1G1_9SOLA|nr:hypothetical protein RND71_030920 [Anisodus tanguticus]
MDTVDRLVVDTAARAAEDTMAVMDTSAPVEVMDTAARAVAVDTAARVVEDIVTRAAVVDTVVPVAAVEVVIMEAEEDMVTVIEAVEEEAEDMVVVLIIEVVDIKEEIEEVAVAAKEMVVAVEEVGGMVIGVALIRVWKYACFNFLSTVTNSGIYGCNCGNLNFARRVECNKCVAPSPAGNDDRGGGGGSGYNRGGNDEGYANNRGGRGDNYDRRSGGSNRNGSYPGNQGRDDCGYGHGLQVAQLYYGGPDRNYPRLFNTHGGNPEYSPDAVPPPASYSGGPASYPPSHAITVGDGGNIQSDARGGGRSGPQGGYGGGPKNEAGSYGSAPDEAPAKVKQCDEHWAVVEAVMVVTGAEWRMDGSAKCC